MPTSARKTSANRINALRSTGPKSIKGKSVASINSLKHGLTAKSNLDSQAPWFLTMVQLIDDEINDRSIAEDLALKILELERTLLAQQTVAMRVAQGQDGYLDEQELQRVELEMSFAAQFKSQAQAELAQKGWSKRRREVLRLDRDIGHFLGQAAVSKSKRLKSDAIAEASRLRRYYKRSTNQLIKAIRQLAKPSGTHLEII